MIFLKSWLQDYIKEDLPHALEIAEKVGLHSFEVEGVEKHGDDYIIDIDVLPNRAHDALSYIGMAREIALVFGFELKEPEVKFDTKGVDTKEKINLKIENPKLTRRATKRLVSNVEVGPSPKWLVKKLEAMGQQSINNIVDATNFVMFETGQPVHAFDYNKLAKDNSGMVNISIRGAKKGEHIKMLDGKEFTLEEGMLVIADDKQALDIAGVKGGVVSGIDEGTKNVMLSVCSFDASNIRKTSKSLGLRTDASSRFEKDISPEVVGFSMDRVSQLVSDLAKGDVAPAFLDEYPRKANPYKTGMSLERLNKILGTDISEKELEKIFDRFGFKYEKVKPLDVVAKSASNYLGKPYLYGASVSYDAPNAFDCSSYVAYLYAQAGVSIPRTSIDQYVFGEKIQEPDLSPGDLIFINTQKGNIWYETQVYMKGTKVPEGVDHVVLYVGDGEIMHATRSTGNVTKVKLSDYKYKNNVVGYCRMADNKERYVVTVPSYRLDLREEIDLIEELGRIYGYENIKEEEPFKEHGPVSINKQFYWVNKIRDILVKGGFSEVYNYTFVDKGDVEVKKALSEDKRFLRKSLSDGLENSLNLGKKNAPLLGVEKIKIFEIGTVFSKNKEFVELVVSEDVKELLSKELSVKIDKLPLNVTDLLDILPDPENYKDLEKLELNANGFKEISSYPFVLRDIAVWVSSDRKPEAVLKVIRVEAGGLCVNASLFDVYEKENKTSYAFKLVFQSQHKTLTDEEVNVVMDNINKEIEANGWEVR